MTEQEQIDKLNKEVARLKASNSRLHGRVVAMSARVTELELSNDNYASQQELLVEELAHARATRPRASLDDDWSDTNWGA